MEDIVSRRADHYRGLLTLLSSAGEVSYLADVSQSAVKELIITSASFFEARITADLEDFFYAVDETGITGSFVRSRTLSRRYHDLFDWNAVNINRFFSWFGEEFKGFAKEWIDSEESRTRSARAFVTIGAARNRLVHGNYGVYEPDLSLEDVLRLHADALVLVLQLPGLLESFKQRH